MEKERESGILLMNLSGAYEEQDFWREERSTWVRLEDLSGTNCYCDEPAVRAIREKIGEFTLSGIHFIDSGNYHYMTRIWMDKAKNPFSLLVFDNHTDMQPPAFGGLLSCGGWIADALESVKLLDHVFLVGPDQSAFHQVQQVYKERVTFFSREDLQAARQTNSSSGVAASFLEMLSEYEKKTGKFSPVYLSVDKDVLNEQEVKTTWSQGDMSLTELKSCLEELQSFLKARKLPLQAADVCGEWEPENGGAGSPAGHDHANHELLEVLKGFDYEE
ncbi:MAG: arginase family protein [Blautia sp.]|nr:arginase family protein [Blautia sp.]